MMRFVPVHSGNPRFPHQFHLEVGRETSRVKTDFFSDAITWTNEEVGRFGEAWTMSGYTISFHRDVDAVIFRIRWG